MDGKISSSSLASGPRETSSHDELFMQQRLIFSNTLKELKNLKNQLYSAAEYFELSYNKEDHHKQIVVESLKDYAIKALVNTVDHLGSVAYKVNRCLDEQIEDVSAFDLRISCVHQRLQTCQEYINRGGLLEQSSFITTPTYHKRYILPAEEMMMGTVGITKSRPRSLNAEYNLDQFKYAEATIKQSPSSFFREWHSPLQKPPQFLLRRGTFTNSLINKKPEKQTASSPQRFTFMRSVSVRKRSTSPNTDKQCPSEPKRSASLSMFAEREGTNEMEQYSSKSKSMFKALMSMRKSRKEGTLFKYLDDI